MQFLARRYRVLAPDLLGHGESDKPHGDWTLGTHASFLRDLLGGLEIRGATVVGHSLGGGIAMPLSYQHPRALRAHDPRLPWWVRPRGADDRARHGLLDVQARRSIAAHP